MKKHEVETTATVFERSRQRPVIVVFDLPGCVGFRLKGTTRVFYLDACSLFTAAVRAQIEADGKGRRKARGRR